MTEIDHYEKVAAARWGTWFSFATAFLCLVTFFFCNSSRATSGKLLRFGLRRIPVP